MDNDFRQTHSPQYLEMAFRTDRHETTYPPDGYGKKAGVCGDTVEMYLAIKNGMIKSITFHIQGCLSTNASANAVAFLAEGKPVEDAWEITPEHVIKYLETLPVGDVHCAELSTGAFYLALADYRRKMRAPWKRTYAVK